MSLKTTRELAHLGYIHVHIYSFTSPLLSLTVVGTVLAGCVYALLPFAGEDRKELWVLGGFEREGLSHHHLHPLLDGSFWK